MSEVFGTTDAGRWPGQLGALLRRPERCERNLTGAAEVDGLLFAHTRLSVLGPGDPGRLPAASRDGRVTVAFNGEIYNFREVAQALGLAGLRSDAQLLAEVLAKDPRQVALLRGMYAFVAWDSDAQQLLAARDPIGIKPLYVLRHTDGELSFASQIPPLLNDPDGRQVDHVGLSTYLAFGHTGPGLTCFNAIQKLEPGSLHRWQRTGAGYERSAQRLAAPPARTDDLEGALRDSVQAHLVADLEVGTFLDGAVSSTLLTCFAAQQCQRARSFTVAFPESPDSDESALARHNAQLIGSEHAEVPVTLAELAGVARSFLREHGEPLADAAMLPLAHLSLTVGKELRAVLCDGGADQMFGRYVRYRVGGRLPRTRLVPLPRVAADRWGVRRGGQPWERALEATLAASGFRGHSALLDGHLPLLGVLDPVARRDVEALVSSGWHTSAATDLGRARRYDADVLLPNLLLEMFARSTAAGSLEGRLPFLDREVAAAAAREPQTPDPSKAPLRQLLARSLPGVQLADRRKGPAVDMRTLVSRHFAQQVEHQLVDPLAALSRWRGRPDDGHARQYAERSPTFAYRLAMLDEWQTLFDGDLTWAT